MSEEGTQYFIQGDTDGEYVQAELTAQPTFKESLPEGLRENESLTKYENTGELASAHVELLSQQPTKPATPEEYKLETPEGFQANEGLVTAFKKIAHENGVSQEQFSALTATYVADYIAQEKAMNDSIQAHRTESENALKTKWGADYDKNFEMTKGFMANIGKLLGKGEVQEPFTKFMEDTRFGDETMVLEVFHALSKVISEDSMQTGESGTDTDVINRGADGRPMLKFKSME